MFDIFSIAVMICAITFTIWLISIRIRDYRRAEIDKIFSLGRVNVLKNGFVFNLILFFLYLGIFIYKSTKVYEVLNPEHLNNIFQMFNIRHLENLEATFLENKFLSDYLKVSRFRNEFLILLMTIVVEFCILTYKYFLTKIENIIYSDGLLLNGKLIPWQTIRAYQWEEKKDFFNNKPVKTLTIKSNTQSSFTFASKQSIDLTAENERMVNYYLNRYSIESKSIA